MRVVAASEAKTQFLKILDSVEQGETVTITRHGRTIAHIVPDAAKLQEDRAKAIEEMRELRRKIGRMSIEEILSARDEGRA